MNWQPFETIYSAISDKDFDFVFSVKFSDGTIKNLDLETILEWDNGASSEYGNKDIIFMEENRDKNISHFMQTMILFRKKST